MTLIVAAIKPGLFAQQLLGALFLCEKNAAGSAHGMDTLHAAPKRPVQSCFPDSAPKQMADSVI